MTIPEIKQFLSQNQTWAKKNYGQHFLVDENALNLIVQAAELKATDRVLEIGPGLGVLTKELVVRAGEVVAIEADEFLTSFLSKKYQVSNIKYQVNSKAQNSKDKSKDCHGLGGLAMTDMLQSELQTPDSGLRTSDLRLIEGDAIQVIDSLEFKKTFRSKPYKVVANIPYSITSRLLRLLLEEYQPDSITFLVQKEVAERVCAKAGAMSLLSLSVQYFGQPSIIAYVPASSFWPAPKVDSAILHILVDSRFRGNDGLGSVSGIDAFGTTDSGLGTQDLFKLAKIGFSSRRKTLANNLSNGLKIERSRIVDIIKSVGLKDSVRAQELSVDDWQMLAEKLG